MECLSPSTIEIDKFKRLVPCRHCAVCCLKRQLAWTMRIMLEQSTSLSSAFVTLTYEDEVRPGYLEKSHIQKYMKRLRKNIPTSVRYFCCGEYGKLSEREHWHLILFNLPPLYSTERLTELWSENGKPLGFVHIGSVTKFSARYAAKYSLKTALYAEHAPQHVMLSSRRPAIGVERIKHVGLWLAHKYPHLEVFPSWWRWDNKLYPLDATMINHARGTYEGAGGTVLKPQQSALSADHTARHFAIHGNPLNDVISDLAVKQVHQSELRQKL